MHAVIQRVGGLPLGRVDRGAVGGELDAVEGVRQTQHLRRREHLQHGQQSCSMIGK